MIRHFLGPRLGTRAIGQRSDKTGHARVAFAGPDLRRSLGRLGQRSCRGLPRPLLALPIRVVPSSLWALLVTFVRDAVVLQPASMPTLVPAVDLSVIARPAQGERNVTCPAHKQVQDEWFHVPSPVAQASARSGQPAEGVGCSWTSGPLAPLPGATTQLAPAGLTPGHFHLRIRHAQPQRPLGRRPPGWRDDCLSGRPLVRNPQFHEAVHRGRAGVRERVPISDFRNRRELKPDGIRGGRVSYPGKPYCSGVDIHSGRTYPGAQRTLGYPTCCRPTLENRPGNGEPGTGREQRVADPWVVLRTQGL